MNEAITNKQETITNEQLGRLIDILFYTPLYRLINWEHDADFVTCLINMGFSVTQVNRFMTFISERLRSFRYSNNYPLNLNSMQRLIDLVGESNFVNRRQELISAASNIVNGQIQNQSFSDPFTQFINSMIQGLRQSSEEFKDWFGEFTGNISGQMAIQMGMPYMAPWMKQFTKQFTMQMLNPLPDNSMNNANQSYQTSQTNQIQYQPQPYQTNQPNQIQSLTNFLKSLTDPTAPYWGKNTRTNLESLSNLFNGFSEMKILINFFIDRLNNDNTNKVLNLRSVRNAFSKIENNVIMEVNDIANIFFDLSEIYPNINRNKQVPSLVGSQERPR